MSKLILNKRILLCKQILVFYDFHSVLCIQPMQNSQQYALTFPCVLNVSLISISQLSCAIFVEMYTLRISSLSNFPILLLILSK